MILGLLIFLVFLKAKLKILIPAKIKITGSNAALMLAGITNKKNT